MMKRSVIAILIMAAVGIGLVSPADSTSFMYTQRRKVMNVGVLTLSDAPCVNQRPYIFFVLDQRTDLKPPGWEFVNPCAPARANAIVRSCHTRLGEDQAIYKNMSAYWEVPLGSTSLANLMQFNLLYLSIKNNPPLDAIDSEKLRKFVDGGGQLWLDCSSVGGSWSSETPFFIPFPTFGTTNGGFAQVVNRHHATISYPYWLTDSDLNYLGPMGASGGHAQADIGWYTPVVLNSNSDHLPVVAVAEYGSGHVIVTSGDIGYGIAHDVNSDMLAIDVGGRLTTAANPVCLKFAYNVAAWTGVYKTFHRDARHSGRSSDPTDAPMVEKWRFPGTFNKTTAAFLKGVFFVSGNGYVYAFDADPGQDLDMDGNPDDGIPDTGATGGYDLIWQYPVVGEVSSPTVATVPALDSNNTTISKEVVFVLTGGGKVIALEAFPTGTDGRLLGLPPLISDMCFDTGYTRAIPPPAPTYYGGWVYVSVHGSGLFGKETGILHAYSVVPKKLHAARFPDYPDPDSTDNPPGPLLSWKFPSKSPFTLGEIVGSPTVGFVKDETSEALDFVVYLSCKSVSEEGLNLGGRMIGLVLAVRNERLRPTNSANTFETRQVMPPVMGQTNTAIWSASHSNRPNVTVNTSSTPGRYTIMDNTQGRKLAVYLDYQLDPTSPGFRPITHLEAPSATDPSSPSVPLLGDITSTPAMSDQDIVYYGALRAGTAQNRGGHIYAFREGGPSRDQIKWQYYLNQDVITDYWADTGVERLAQVQVGSTPAISGNVVYVTGTTIGGIGVLMAFDANPDFCFYLDYPVDTTRPASIQQTDWFTDPNGAVPPIPISTRSSNCDTYSEGKVAVKNFFSMSLTPSADVTINYFSPDGAAHNEIHYAFPNRPDVLPFVQGRPAINDKWNNLLWYYIPRHPGTRCKGISSSPTVIGDYVYFVCDDGYLIAVEARPHMSDPNIPKNGQIWDDAKPLNPNAQASYVSHVKWMERVTESAVGGSNSAQYAVAGAGGYLGVVTPAAFVAFDNPCTLVADSNRILEVDGGGNALWTCEGTTERGVAGGALTTTGTGILTSQRKSFNHPTAVKRIGSSEYICADTGNNRVVRFDRGGTTLLEISGFVDPLRKLDPGDPLTLNGPTDVYTWTNREQDPVPTGKPAVIQHYLIADKGNFRVLDLGLRINADTGEPLDPPAYVVLWVSRTHNLGKRYAYQTAQLAPDPINPNIIHVLASIGNYAVGGIAVESDIPEQTGSSVVLLNYRTLTDRDNLKWTYNNGYLGSKFISEMDNGPISGLTYFARFYSAGSFTDVICDAAGVHIHRPDDTWWHLMSDAYANIKRKLDGDWSTPEAIGVPLRATSAKLLGNGHLLISNAYVGNDNWGGAFHGEVVEVDPSTGAIMWSAPRPVAVVAGGVLEGVEYMLGGTSTLAEPGFADR